MRRAVQEGARRRSASRAFQLVALAGLWALPARAFGQPITNNDFGVDLGTGPVLGSSRIVGMGGAHTALASGIDGAAFNPASYAARTLHELDNFEPDFALSMLFPGSFARNDFFNNDLGEGVGTDSFLFVDGGLRLQWADLGLGALVRFQGYDLVSGEDETRVRFTEVHVGAGYAFLDGQLVVGAGVRAGFMEVQADYGFSVDPDAPPEFATANLAAFSGAGLEVGTLLRLDGAPWRLGAAFRTRVRSGQLGSDEVQQVGEGMWVPRSATLPWEIRAGIAWQFGPRPLNRRWQRPKRVAHRLIREMRDVWCARERAQVLREHPEADPSTVSCPRLRLRAESDAWREQEEERQDAERDALEDRIDALEDQVEVMRFHEYESLPRPYVVIAADVVLIGRVFDAIGLDALLDQELRRRGDQVSTAFHLGVEGEPWRNRLKVRSGIYVEPGRNRGVSPRCHWTAGFDVRLVRIQLLGPTTPLDIKAGMVVDLAREYVDWGLSVGFWH